MNNAHLDSAAKFGECLIRTGDLDPTYIAMSSPNIDRNQLKRLLLAYTCLYHLGASAQLSLRINKAFWDNLYAAAVNEGNQWPRGTERRHWRGDNAINSARSLMTYPTPEAVVDYWSGNGKTQTFIDVTTRVREAVGFGPWIAFKIADLLERVLKVPVQFSDCGLNMYEEPRKGAALILTGDEKYNIGKAELDDVVQALARHPKLRKLKAPPYLDRPINIQEIETILCKYKSHCFGHYPEGKDTKEVLHGLEEEKQYTATISDMKKALTGWKYA